MESRCGHHFFFSSCASSLMFWGELPGPWLMRGWRAEGGLSGPQLREQPLGVCLPRWRQPGPGRGKNSRFSTEAKLGPRCRLSLHAPKRE